MTSFEKLTPPTRGTPIRVKPDHSLDVPDDPIIPFIEGDGTGPDIWAASRTLAVMEMAEAILRDKKRILPTCAYLDGEYGIKGYYMGVPALLGAGGVEKIVEMEFSSDEKAELNKSLEHVKGFVDGLKL